MCYRSCMTMIQIDTTDTYRRRHTMRFATEGASSVVSTVPLDVVKRAAGRRGVTLEEFIRTHDIEYLYNGSEGAFLRFVPKAEK